MESVISICDYLVIKAKSSIKNRSLQWILLFLLVQTLQRQVQGIERRASRSKLSMTEISIKRQAESSTAKIQSANDLHKIKKYETEPRGEIYSHIFVAEELAAKIEQLLFGSTGCNKELSLLDSRVIGGNSAQYGSQPWQVEISEILENGQKKHYCSGAILNARNILTTAHCFSVQRSKDSFVIIAGDYDRSAKDEYEQFFSIEKVTIHPNYQKVNKFDNDIAIVKLKSSNKSDGFIFGPYVQPACIPRAATPHAPGTSCTVSGWGITEDTPNANSTVKVLQSARVKLISSTLCQDLYKNYNPVGEGMLCAGHLQGGIDACKGDSGGPLICNITGQQFLTGLVSWGDGCAQPNRPGVYVHVQHYLDWIHKTLQLG